jgi:hypothetical protein
MASSLPTSRYQSENDLRALMKAVWWQSPGYDLKMRHGMLSLTQVGDFVYFSAYALAGLAPLFSSFFSCAVGVLRDLTSTPIATLHHVGGDLRPLLQDVHGVRSSVGLFRWFHVLRPVNREPPSLGGYYF